VPMVEANTNTKVRFCSMIRFISLMGFGVGQGLCSTHNKKTQTKKKTVVHAEGGLITGRGGGMGVEGKEIRKEEGEVPVGGGEGELESGRNFQIKVKVFLPKS